MNQIIAFSHIYTLSLEFFRCVFLIFLCTASFLHTLIVTVSGCLADCVDVQHATKPKYGDVYRVMSVPLIGYLPTYLPSGPRKMAGRLPGILSHVVSYLPLSCMLPPVSFLSLVIFLFIFHFFFIFHSSSFNTISLSFSISQFLYHPIAIFLLLSTSTFCCATLNES